MKKKTGFWIVLAALLFVFLIYVSWQVLGTTDASAELLTKQDAKKIVQDRYQGTVLQIRLADNQYQIKIEKGNKLYKIKLDPVSGKVLSFTNNGTKSQPPNQAPVIDSTKRLTEDEAKDIANKQVSGTVDDIKLETKGEQTYYLVKIKTNDNREAFVQIHAITGNVMSISWDDHSNDNSKKNDDSKNQSTNDDRNDDSKNPSTDDKNDDSKNRGTDDKKKDDD
ncbi:PepSY domain-containing protein [Neobacillus drentensis]|uniref:PepSY domain-containing protein n=1 Tax=Neobacillus drentensis TaxID=220684 RepID=UPI002FFF584F